MTLLTPFRLYKHTLESLGLLAMRQVLTPTQLWEMSADLPLEERTELIERHTHQARGILEDKTGIDIQ